MDSVQGTDDVRLERSSLREQARRVLRTRVITGELETGKLYSVGEFSKMLGVSATPVREALGDLEQVGLVEVIRNRGFMVPDLTDTDLDEIFELRTMLESAAVERLVKADLPEEGIAAARESMDRCQRSARQGDLKGFLEADRDFHLELIGMLGNQRLVAAVDRIRDQTRLHGFLRLASDDLVEFAEEHESLLRAILERNGDEAKSRLTAHLEHTRALQPPLLSPNS